MGAKTNPMEVYCAHDEIVDVDLLVPHPKNPNQHPQEQVKLLAKIMKHQGWRSPIVVSNRSGFITKGHGRLMAAKLNGWKEAPVDRQDYANEADEYADMVADNKIAELSETSLSMVNQDVMDLGPDFDLDLLGIPDFVVEPLDKLEPQCDEDEIPEPKETRCKPCDIWQLGRHRLMCGDSSDANAAELLMGGEVASLVFTDPPYGVNYQSNMRTRSEKFEVIENDDVFLSEWVNTVPVVSSGWVFVWTTWKVLSKWIDITAPLGEITNLVVWDKGGGGIGDLEGTFVTDHEIALVFNRGAKITGKRIGSVWSVGKDRSTDYLHPTQKPVALAEMAIENVTKPHAAVLDLFGGSGSTLIACEKTNRRCFMMELDPKYCDVILARWEKYTGKLAERLNGKAT